MVRSSETERLMKKKRSREIENGSGCSPESLKLILGNILIGKTVSGGVRLLPHPLFCCFLPSQQGS